MSWFRPSTPVLTWPWVVEMDRLISETYATHYEADSSADQDMEEWVDRVSTLLEIPLVARPTIADMTEWVREVNRKVRSWRE